MSEIYYRAYLLIDDFAHFLAHPLEVFAESLEGLAADESKEQSNQGRCQKYLFQHLINLFAKHFFQSATKPRTLQPNSSSPAYHKFEVFEQGLQVA